MKSIQQTEQLSDRELKAVLRGDEASLGSLIREDAVNFLAGSAGSAVARIMSKTKTAFQVMLEKVIGEEFLAFLEDVAKRNGDASRNGYYSRKIHSAFGDFEIQIPHARYAAFWSEKYKGMSGMLSKTGMDIFAYYAFFRAIRKSNCTSNAIESLNSKLKRERRKRILANSEDNATIITVNVFRSYDKSAGMRTRKGLMEVSWEERKRMEFEI